MQIELSRADTQPAWCPGCGNYPLLKALDRAIDAAGIDRRRLVVVSGIGQAAKTPHYMRANVFNGLHGRAVPAATAIKLVNHELDVVITSGDGDMYGEGGNHLLHAIRRNIGLKAFVHDNQVYGLTKGQASPTSHLGMVTKVQPHGVKSLPFDPLAVAVAESCSFVARTFTGLAEHMHEVMVAALKHRGGLALVDILQPCPSFNRVNTFKWYRDRVRPIGPEHAAHDRDAAMRLAMAGGEEIPIGILFRCDRPSYESQIEALAEGPLVGRYGE
jgi:2-oxoglutarate ferredoxin oxidoreductase subunit beta